MHYSTTSVTHKGLLKPVLWASLIAGTLDAIGAIVVYQANPLRMFQFIASGAIGKENAFTGEWQTALLGVLFHYLIAFFWTGLFFIILPKIRKYSINKYVLGICYGAIVWVGMNLIVLPLSRLGLGSLELKQVLIGMAILMVMIGLPISLLAHRFYASKS